jgi:hypothetical protein
MSCWPRQQATERILWDIVILFLVTRLIKCIFPFLFLFVYLGTLARPRISLHFVSNKLARPVGPGSPPIFAAQQWSSNSSSISSPIYKEVVWGHLLYHGGVIYVPPLVGGLAKHGCGKPCGLELRQREVVPRPSTTGVEAPSVGWGSPMRTHDHSY